MAVNVGRFRGTLAVLVAGVLAAACGSDRARTEPAPQAAGATQTTASTSPAPPQGWVPPTFPVRPARQPVMFVHGDADRGGWLVVGELQPRLFRTEDGGG